MGKSAGYGGMDTGGGFMDSNSYGMTGLSSPPNVKNSDKKVLFSIYTLNFVT